MIDRQHIIRSDACCQLLCCRHLLKVNDALCDALVDQQICINGIIDTINISFVRRLLQNTGPIRSAGVISEPDLAFVLPKDGPVKVIEVVVIVCIDAQLLASGRLQGIKILLDVSCAEF